MAKLPEERAVSYKLLSMPIITHHPIQMIKAQRIISNVASTPETRLAIPQNKRCGGDLIRDVYQQPNASHLG